MKNKLSLLFLVIVLIMSCGCIVLKKNEYLNQDGGRGNPMKEEMNIPWKFKITNTPPPFNNRVMPPAPLLIPPPPPLNTQVAIKANNSYDKKLL